MPHTHKVLSMLYMSRRIAKRMSMTHSNNSETVFLLKSQCYVCVKLAEFVYQTGCDPAQCQ